MLKKLLLLLVFSIPTVAAIAQQKTYLIGEVASSPEFPGGSQMLRSFISSNFEMPEDADVFGQIEIGFVVDSKGRLSNFEIVKDLGSGTGNEALRIFSLSPRWIPGKLADGTPVNVYFVLPIKLQSK